MKINEPFGAAREQDVADEARLMETEVLAQLKSEFQDFVAQTRERLRMVSESLVELDREYSLAPPVVDQPVNAQQAVEAQPAYDAAVEPVQAHLPERIVDPTPPVGAASEAPVSELNFWSEGPADPDPQPTFPQPTVAEDASTDASFPRSNDLDSDPTERLKAIKQRLARQIENS